MAVLTAVQASVVPVVNTLVAAAGGGDKYNNSGRERFRVRNGGGSTITVTITAVAALGCPAGTLHDISFTVAAGAEKVVGALDPLRFNDSNGQVSVGYSAVTSVTVGVEL